MGPLVLNFWRPPTCNDMGASLHEKLAFWQDAGRSALPVNPLDVSVDTDSDSVIVKVDLKIGEEGATVSLKYEVSPQKIHIGAHWQPGNALSQAPPRVGFTGTLVAGFETVEWFGRGPHEAYIDRSTSARVGRFTGLISEQTFKYVRPQENGNKLDTRWMALRRGTAGSGLLITAIAPTPTLAMQCHRFNLADFGCHHKPEWREQLVVRHGGELSECPETSICVDAAQMGVGGSNSWGRLPLKEHMIPADLELRWAFQLRPLSSVAMEGRNVAAIAREERSCRAATLAWVCAD